MPPLTPAEIQANFAAQPESEQVASSFAATGLSKWLHRMQVQQVAEWGTGLGTLTRVILCVRPMSHIWTHEPDSWFRQAAKHNLQEWTLRIQWFDQPWPEMKSWPGEFDCLIIDGPPSLLWIPLRRRAFVFVEGGRRDQRKALEQRWRRTRSWCHAEWKPPDRTKGYHVYLLEPSWIERLWFAAVRLREEFRDDWYRLLGRPVGKRRR